MATTLRLGSETWNADGRNALSVNRNSPIVIDRLEPDTLNTSVYDYSTEVKLLAAGGVLDVLVAADGKLAAAKRESVGINRYPYGSRLTLNMDGNVSLYNVEQIKRVGKYLYEISAISNVGLLLNSQHYGGIYNGIKLAELLREIIGTVFSYTVDASVQDIPVYGWLPIDTRRNNLHKVLFATGITVDKSANGITLFTAPTIPPVYALGDVYEHGSITEDAPATYIGVTEHTYTALPDDEYITVVDGYVTMTDVITPLGRSEYAALVTFAEPLHDLRITDGTIIESGANYAVISATVNTVLEGQRYTHVERVISVNNAGSDPNEYSVTDCGVISVLNSENVLAKMAGYYRNTDKVNLPFVFTTQNCGDKVSFTDPFDQPSEGIIESMDITVSAINRADAVITRGNIIPTWGNNYAHVDTITQSGTYTLPPEATSGKIRVVVIGGGQGGYAGLHGENGELGSSTAGGDGSGGAGGLAGNGGKGGNVNIATISARAGQTFTVVIGTGGAGATPTADDTINIPSDGTATRFGSLTSADGGIIDYGYISIIDGTIYAVNGSAGVNGGDGSAGNDHPERGGNVMLGGTTYTPGAQGNNHVVTSTSQVAYGGGGGGAAGGTNGNAGLNAYQQIVSAQDVGVGGKGGNGANASIPGSNATIPGAGGNGGHGGGGGGGGGAGTYTFGYGAGGNGGLGSAGGKGADGIVIIYY